MVCPDSLGLCGRHHVAIHVFFATRCWTSILSADSISRPNQDGQATNHPPDHNADSIAEDFGTWMAFELGLVVEIWHFWVKKGVVPGSEEFTLRPLAEQAELDVVLLSRD